LWGRLAVRDDQMVHESAHLGGRVWPAGKDGVGFDRFERIVSSYWNDRARCELVSAHPDRGDGKAKSCLDAGDHPFGGGGLDTAADSDRQQRRRG
jgi:hypothetical protein